MFILPYTIGNWNIKAVLFLQTSMETFSETTLEKYRHLVVILFNWGGGGGGVWRGLIISVIFDFKTSVN